MPLMTGGTLAAAILKARPGMPIIICTGYSEDLSEEQAAAMGIKAFRLEAVLYEGDRGDHPAGPQDAGVTVPRSRIPTGQDAILRPRI